MLTRVSVNGSGTSDTKSAMLALIGREVGDERVVAAMARVPRERFLPPGWRHLAYADNALPTQRRQTVSQPLIVAMMTAAVDPHPGDRVLEIGTGSGYQAAALAELVRQVVTVERVPELA